VERVEREVVDKPEPLSTALSKTAAQSPIGNEARQINRSHWSIALIRFKKNKGAMIGLGATLMIVVIALAAPWLAPYDPVDQDLGSALQPPSGSHFFGTDQFGRDIYSRVLYGALISLQVGMVSVGVACFVGIPLGLMAGFYLGIADVLISRLVDILLALPSVLLALGIMAVLGPSLTNAMIAVGISLIPQYARITRGSALLLKELEYVIAARVTGCTNMHIMTRHILPNLILPLLVITSLEIPGAILFASALSFLGLGAQPPTPEWGAMLSTGRTYLHQAWWMPVFPGLAIMVAVLAMNLLGDGLRDALDPRAVFTSENKA
jgi:peptide/nickel transport system permease protein